jgi:DNA polymerase-3 subunit alpha
VHFIEQDDFEAHEARVCIADGYVGDDKRPNYSPEQYLKLLSK